jgi:hypothetical protein
MKSCPTSNMNKSKMWGFEVSQIVASFFVLASINIGLNLFGGPLILSWVAGLTTLVVLRVISHGQKNGHLELAARYLILPHIYLGHKERLKKGSSE